MIRRAGILLILSVSIFAAVFFGYEELKKSLKIRKPAQAGPAEVTETEKGPNVAQSLRKTKDYQIIVTRNIFQAATKAEETSKQEELDTAELEQTKLDLSLEGTITGDKENARAIITDNKTRKQQIYRIGDTVEGAGAEIKSIERGKIVLSYQGRNEVLLLKERSGGRQPEFSERTPNLTPSFSARSPQLAPRSRIPIVRPKRRLTFEQRPTGRIQPEEDGRNPAEQAEEENGMPPAEIFPPEPGMPSHPERDEDTVIEPVQPLEPEAGNQQ